MACTFTVQTGGDAQPMFQTGQDVLQIFLHSFGAARQVDDERFAAEDTGCTAEHPARAYRREITWSVFDEKANRVANMLLGRGIKKGDRVAILMFNCLEWLPIYFGILKTGAIAVPFNFRFSADEIQYCADFSRVV